jgi:tetratricopeptide (TPR) repeat protein
MALQSSELQRDAEVAAALRRELLDSGQASRVSVRSLRDRFGRTRLTAAGRTQIARALERTGIEVEPGLDRVSLDEEVVLRLVDRRSSLLRWARLLLRGGSRAWRVTVATLGLLATLTGLWVFFKEEVWPPDPPPLAGNLNLAVAPFTAAGGDTEADGEREGERLAKQVRKTLGDGLGRRKLRSRLIFEIAPPPPVEPVRGETPDERADAAARSARRVGAHVLVYGTVRLDQFGTVVAPSFYISGGALTGAEEFVGSHRLGAPLEITGSVADNPVASDEARRLLAARTRMLSDFVVGLSYFERREYATASRWFREAERTAGSAGGGAHEVIYLFLGHAAGRMGRLERAERFYARALEAEPGYTRARFGMAEVRYQRAHGGCDAEGTDENGLRAAGRGFQAVERQHGPYGAPLKARARFARARVLFCLSQAGIEPLWGEAVALFEYVVRAYRRDPLLREEASEALGYIGSIRLPARGEADRERKLEQAAPYYRRALHLSPDPDRRALFSDMLGSIYEGLGRVTAAQRAYRRAAQLTTDPNDRRRYEGNLRDLLER